MQTTTGRAFFLGDNVDTDQILPGFAMSYPPDKLAAVALCQSEIPDFASLAKPGDFIIARDNFGCGSSREQAPAALKAAGVGAIVASSFARIFRRNSINIGLPVVTSEEVEAIRSDASADDEFSIDPDYSRIVNVTKNKTYALVPLSAGSLETLRAGGLINKARAKLAERARFKREREE